MTDRTCTKCGTSKPATLDYFPRLTDRRLRPECKPCWKRLCDERRAARREYYRKRTEDYRANNPDADRRGNLRRSYGISVEQYDAISESQGGACAHCGAQPKTSPLCVDHDHATGEVRGLLCYSCNMSLARLGDDVASVRHLLDYLEDAPRRMGVVMPSGPAYGVRPD